jgi:hypothetical protein
MATGPSDCPPVVSAEPPGVVDTEQAVRAATRREGIMSDRNARI